MIPFLDRFLAHVVLESIRATLSTKAGALDPDNVLLRAMPGLGLPKPGFLL